MGRKAKYASEADRQKAYRERKRNAPSVTKCPLCGSNNTIPVSEDQARQFGVYCECLCFECNGLTGADGHIWGFVWRAHDLPEWVVIKD